MNAAKTILERMFGWKFWESGVAGRWNFAYKDGPQLPGEHTDESMLRGCERDLALKFGSVQKAAEEAALLFERWLGLVFFTDGEGENHGWTLESRSPITFDSDLELIAALIEIGLGDDLAEAVKAGWRG